MIIYFLIDISVDFLKFYGILTNEAWSGLKYHLNVYDNRISWTAIQQELFILHNDMSISLFIHFPIKHNNKLSKINKITYKILYSTSYCFRKFSCITV